MKKLIFSLFVFALISCDNGKNNSIQLNSSTHEESIEPFTRGDIVGLWFLMISSNSDSYIREIGNKETSVIRFDM